MRFSIDRQTLDELNLLGKFRQGSVYHLFNQVKTRGGETLLDNMFRRPLDNVDAINQRSAIFRFFEKSNVDFPFDVQQVAIMSDYIDSGSNRSFPATFLATVVKKSLSALTRDEGYKKQVQGIQAIVVILSKCHLLVEQLSKEGPFADRLRAIAKILSEPPIVHLRDTDIYRSLPLQKLVHFDYLLKGRYAQKMAEILQFVYEVDVYIAVSHVSRANGFCYANAMPAETNLFMAEGIRHPCIKGAVGNSLCMNEDSNVLFLTGANMAGKSTLMKSVGIGVYLAHMGFPVAAEQLNFSVREGLYTSINVADSIRLGYSHFYAEVVRVKQAAEAAASGKHLFLMFDELFKGTNVKDAYDGTLAVTEAFSDYEKCLFIVSTHIIEVGEALRKNSNIRFRYLPTILEGARPKYTYRLKEGITEDRQGMMIIRNEGILELISSKRKSQ